MNYKKLVSANNILIFRRISDFCGYQVYLMGRIASSIKNDKEEEKEFNNEKENICFLSTMLMAVGNSLADLIDEEETKQASSSTGDTKRQKKA